MNTLRAPRPLDVGRGPAGMLARTIVVTACLCAAAFAASFAIGRAQRPGVAPREQLAPSPSAAATGPAIPISLSSAPPIALEVVRAPARASTRVSTPAAVVAGAAAATVVAAQPASVPLAPIHATTPAAKAPATPHAPPRHASGGTSFDSSG